MKYTPVSALFKRADEYELQLCREAISWSTRHQLQSFFRVVSRLGDGVFWYSILLGIFYIKGMEVGTYLALTGLSCTLIYKALKIVLVRERPYITHSGINCAGKALDRYSFPSGHTLHAVCFLVLFTYVHPVLGLLVLPFTLCVALSRVVLGLHYPSDVGAGAMIGFTIASLAITFFPF